MANETKQELDEAVGPLDEMRIVERHIGKGWNWTTAYCGAKADTGKYELVRGGGDRYCPKCYCAYQALLQHGFR